MCLLFVVPSPGMFLLSVYFSHSPFLHYANTGSCSIGLSDFSGTRISFSYLKDVPNSYFCVRKIERTHQAGNIKHEITKDHSSSGLAWRRTHVFVTSTILCLKPRWELLEILSARCSRLSFLPVML